MADPFTIASAVGAGLKGLGSLASGIKTLFGSSGGTSLYKSSQLMRSQNLYQKDFAKWYLNNITKNQYHAERAGLERAGYNPMLAYMNGSSGVPIPSTNASAVSGQESQAGSQGFGAFLASMQTASQIKNTNANTALQLEQSTTETFKQLNLSIDSSLKNIEKQLKEVDLKYSDKEHLLRQQQMLNDMKVSMMNALSNQVSSNAHQVEASVSNKTYKLNKDVRDIEKDREKRYKEWGEKYPVWRNIDETITRYFNGVSSSISKKVK